MIAPSREQGLSASSDLRLNIAAALFDRQVAIDSALRDVVASGFAKLAYSILVDAQSREFAQLGDVYRVPLLAVPVHRIDSATAQDGTFLIRGDVTRQHDGTQAQATRSCNPNPGAGGAAMQVLERHGHRLQGHFARGGAVLIARVDTLAEQQSICSMLLHYASDGLLTHQIRASAARPLQAFLAHCH